MDPPGSPPPAPPTLWQVIHSVAAAFFGVQSSKNRERDFQHGKPWHYVVIALLMTGLFALTLIGIVRAILHFAR